MADVSMTARATAALIVAVAREQFGEDIGYDEAGVLWLDGYIQQRHERPDPSQALGLLNVCGAFLGESIIETFGGIWDKGDNWRWCVRLDDGNVVYPYGQVGKHLQRFSRGCNQYPQWTNQLRQSLSVTAANASPRAR